jgi:molybdopterin molybdotransferase
MTEVAQAESLILERVSKLGTRTIPLGDAVGAVLREDVCAERDYPPFDRVTMDGIAIAYRDWQAKETIYQVVGTQAAGAPPIKITKPCQCVEIMTGAVLPVGTDTVVPIERVRRRNSEAQISADTPVSARQFIHPRGSDRLAGTHLIRSGTRIGPAETAILASAGYSQVIVSRLPRVAVISTGDELVGVDEPIKPYQIRSSNDRAIEASLIRHQLAQSTRTRLKDERAKMLHSVGTLHHDHDVLILSGGVSMGKYDFVPAVLEDLGIKLILHQIEQRPGRPMWFGVSGEGKLVFALPGNPVSTLVCLTRYVIPALGQALGLRPAALERVVLGEDVTFSSDLTYFLPVQLKISSRGVGVATPRPTNTSGDFISLADTEGFVELSKGRNLFKKGTAVRLFRW